MSRARECGKIQYPNHRAALAAMLDACIRRGGTPKQYQVYKCRYCKTYHWGHGRVKGKRRRW